MSYNLLYTKTAVEDIKKLDSVVKKRVKKKLEDYSKDPLAYAKHLSNSLIGSYRWRIGNYRVIFDMKGKTIMVLQVGHRREIYRG